MQKGTCCSPGLDGVSENKACVQSEARRMLQERPEIGSDELNIAKLSDSHIPNFLSFSLYFCTRLATCRAVRIPPMASLIFTQLQGVNSVS